MIQNNIIGQNIWFEIFELTNNTLQNTKDIFQKYIRTLTHNKSAAKENIKEIAIKGKAVPPKPLEEYMCEDKISYKIPSDEYHLPDFFKGIIIEGDFDISYNKFQETDDCFKNHLPAVVKGNVYLNHNKLTTLEGIKIKVYGDFYCHGNAGKLDEPNNKNFIVHGRFINE